MKILIVLTSHDQVGNTGKMKKRIGVRHSLAAGTSQGAKEGRSPNRHSYFIRRVEL